MKKKVTIISVIIIIILCVIFCSMSLSDSNDTFYLIKLGQSIVNSGIDKLDHFSWIPNLPYTYPHWLYSVFIFFVYNNFGFTGVYLSTLLSFIALVLILYYINIKMNKSHFIAIVTVIISIIPLGIFMVPRSQSLSIILLVLEVYFINQLINTGKKQYIVYLAICSLLIANIHATIWIVIFVFFLPFFGEHLLYLYSKKKHKEISFNGRISVNKINNIKYLLIAFVVCFIMGIFSPTRICYTYFIKTSLGDSQSYISEHLPTIVIEFPLMIILWVFLFFSKSKIKISEFLMLGGITLMSLIAQRHLIFFSTIGLLYFSIILIRNVNEKKDMTFEILEKKVFGKILIPSSIIIILLCLCFFNVKSKVNDGFIDNTVYPQEAVKYIKENLDYKNIKIINEYDFGSFLLFNDIKVFVDSRADLYYKEFNEMDMNILDDLFEAFSTKKKYNYTELIEKYDADYFLLKSNQDAYYMLKVDSRYEAIYDDDNFALYKIIKKD